MAQYNIEMNSYDGRQYNQLYPKTSLNNVMDWQNSIYSKTEVDNTFSEVNDKITDIETVTSTFGFVKAHDTNVNLSNVSREGSRQILPGNWANSYEDVILYVTGWSRINYDISSGAGYVANSVSINGVTIFIFRVGYSGSDNLSNIKSYAYRLGLGFSSLEGDGGSNKMFEYKSCYLGNNLDVFDKAYNSNAGGSLPTSNALVLNYSTYNSNVTMSFNLNVKIYKRTNPLYLAMTQIGTPLP